MQMSDFTAKMMAKSVNATNSIDPAGEFTALPDLIAVF